MHVCWAMHKSCANIWLICPEPEKMGSNDWQVYPPIHKLHKRLVMIDMFSFHEEDGLAIIKLKVSYKMMFIFFYIEFTD